MENEQKLEDVEHTPPPLALSHSVSWQAINLRKQQRSCSTPLAAANAGNSSDDLKMENSYMDLGPGSSKQCDTMLSQELFPPDAEHILEEILESASLHSIESFVCRICHNCENPEKLVSPCLCKGSLTYVHVYCLERWISTSRCTSCELCQFQYDTQQTLRYSLFESLRIWYSRSMSRRALQEDCQMFSLLTLVAFGLIGTLLVAVQYYILQGHVSGMARVLSKGWLIFFLFATLVVYFVNVYMIAKSHLTPWYRWWQSARDIRLILENRKPYPLNQARGQMQQQQQQQQLQSQHQQQSAMGQQTSAQMPMDQATKGTSGRSPNDTTCPNSVVQSWPQDTGTPTNSSKATVSIVKASTATTTAVAAATLIFLPINNCQSTNNAVGSNVLAAPATDDDVAVASPHPKHCHKTASLPTPAISARKDGVTAEAKSESMLLTSTAKRIFCESATDTATATAVMGYDVPLECGCVRIVQSSVEG